LIFHAYHASSPVSPVFDFPEGNKIGLMFGKTPPSAMVVLAMNLFNSSSFLMAKRMCLGTILVFLLSLAAFPASSKTSAAKYSKTADK
jgi:hypothetical protein